jgi:cystathionine beta-lyase family protein involved in aluminum resistance
VDGYGHGDVGRDTIESIYADLFGAEAALVRVQMFSGTHAISCALFGVLRPGTCMKREVGGHWCVGLMGPQCGVVWVVQGT